MSRPQHGTAAVSLVLITSALAPLTAGCDTSSRHPAHPATTAPRSEAELRQQAEGALTHSSEVRLRWTGAVGKRRTLGKTTPRLPAGKYVLEAACAGSGAVHLFWNTNQPDNDAEPEVHCGGSVARSYFTADNLVAFAFEPSGIDPPSGILTWQIIPS